MLIELFGSPAEIPLVRVFSVKSLTRIKLLTASMRLSLHGTLGTLVGGSFREV